MQATLSIELQSGFAGLGIGKNERRHAWLAMARLRGAREKRFVRSLLERA
ncbi:hypothetical protein VOM14_14760 [Paraburkholderia sp. MPAMCS5]|nr:hypothetical protein [Paraburkholderia sp. MPAMCS5]